MTDIKQYEPLWGSWHVESPLGDGAFGKVYRVRREEFGMTHYAAVKLISIPQGGDALQQVRSEGMDDASARSYLHALAADMVLEIDMMRAFQGNSNIVSIEDHMVIERQGEIGLDILIRMELLTSLKAHIEKRSMEQADVVKLGVHICRALELCGVKGAIHRDIKPENIFVSQFGEFKLGDFGIARQIDHTMSGLSKKGTYTYMAPEVYKGEKYGPSVDTYSLGIVMYRFLNRNRDPFLLPFPEAFTPSDREEAIRRRMFGEPLPPIAGIDPRLSEIVLKACAFNRDERYESAGAMREALEAFAGGMSYAPVAPPSEPFTPRPGPRPRNFPAEGEALDATESVFTSKTKFFAEKPAPAKPKHDARPALLKKISIASGLSFGAFCALCALGVLRCLDGARGELLASLPLYGLCAAQCWLRFRDARLNAALIAALFAYLGYAFLAAFDLFDYHLLTLACGLTALEAGGTGKRQYPLAVAGVFAAGALASGFLVFRALAGVAAGSYQPHIAGGALAVPAVLLLTAPLCLLFTGGKGLRRYARIGLIGLQCFPALVFLLHLILSHSAGVSPFDNLNVWYYIADADFIGLSAAKFPWWTNGRILGQMIQLTAFVPLLILRLFIGEAQTEAVLP